MDFSEYQTQSRTTALYPDLGHNTVYPTLGLVGEAGEVADHVKKIVYQAHDMDRSALINEAGDVLWYIAQLATALDMPLSEIAQRNIAKLQARYPAGFDAKRSINRE